MQVGGYTAPVAYDAADAQLAFQFGNGVGGSISYSVPWDLIDATLATQTIAPADFNLNIAGHNFEIGVANYTTAPTLLFEYGVLAGAYFALDTGAVPGLSLSAFSMSGMFATGTFAGLPPLVAPVVRAANFITMDFAQITTGKAYMLQVEIDVGLQQALRVTISVGAGASVEEIRNTVLAVLESEGIKVIPAGTSKLTIGGKGDKLLTGASFLTGTQVQNGQVFTDATLNGPKLTSQTGGVNVFVNGKKQ